ncbi:MAG: C4-type zinc ribbon domain-containing protein [Edaphobacter sp.]|uniref:zinc ribbon domain-containing protein n=1 Tax=Edaphobacter sp. TaxID=1934404 RepID=UPI0023A3B233|nr:C4-type zinc ribbon domain-containing protein [Edaphobacter sp.]MDE1176819.1 C4-type zinc ribbon domain-containing protein [Edaphobacter sp.]
MHPDLEKMIALQRLDVEAHRLNEEIAALPKRVAQLAAEGAAARRQLAATGDSLAKEESLRRGHELEIKDHQQKAARLGKQMDVVTTTAQANALEHEIAFAKNEVSRLEDAELESMERTETLDLQKKDAEETVANLTRRHAELSASTAEHIASDRARLAEIEAQRAELRPQIGEDSLSIYDRISKSRGTALSEGVDHKCSACQMMLRPQRWNDLRDGSNGDQMLTCETCGRILYWDPARDAPQKKPAERQESIAASIVRATL